jgi:hypothetical protein
VRESDFPEDLSRRRAREAFESARRRTIAEDRRVNRNKAIVLILAIATLIALCAWIGTAR